MGGGLVVLEDGVAPVLNSPVFGAEVDVVEEFRREFGLVYDGVEHDVVQFFAGDVGVLGDQEQPVLLVEVVVDVGVELEGMVGVVQ